MKLVFRKNDQEEITVLQSFDGDERNFIYTDMIKVLFEDGEIEDPVVEGDFTEEEERSISNMVSEINNVTKETLKKIAGSLETFISTSMACTAPLQPTSFYSPPRPFSPGHRDLDADFFWRIRRLKEGKGAGEDHRRMKKGLRLRKR